MRFSVISTVLAFALSVHAATLNKRDVSVPTQTCINSIDATLPELTNVTTKVEAITSPQDLAALTNFYNAASVAYSSVETAGTDCCSITTVVSDEDATALLGEFALMVSKLTGEINVLINNEPIIGDYILGRIYAAFNMDTLQNGTAILVNCLVGITPSTKISELQGYADEIDASFRNAYTTYNMTIDF